MKVIENLRESIEDLDIKDDFKKGYLLGCIDLLKNEFNECEQEMKMQKNITKLMINNLEYKVSENLEQKEMLDLFSKIVKVEYEICGSDSMSLMCEVINLRNEVLDDLEWNKLKNYLKEKQEVVGYVSSKE